MIIQGPSPNINFFVGDILQIHFNKPLNSIEDISGKNLPPFVCEVNDVDEHVIVIFSIDTEGRVSRGDV